MYVCGWMYGIFAGMNKFDLHRSSATKFKPKFVGVSFGVQYIVFVLFCFLFFCFLFFFLLFFLLLFFVVVFCCCFCFVFCFLFFCCFFLTDIRQRFLMTYVMNNGGTPAQNDGLEKLLESH